MTRINPYIHFNGNAEEAFTFYKASFGGEFAAINRYGDFASPDHPKAEEDKKRIMHIALPIGDHNLLMGSDTLSVMGRVNEKDNRNSIAINVDSRDEADRLFKGLSEGGKIEMPLADSPWGSYFGMFTDKFGVQWMLDCNPNA
ncbi:VOC family protein [Marinoscillum pacificum]|uniref:VOC family protein n=1 Tax=Marinoscillum pacificum TaxID=392723 RepID=UPI00215832DB|nr:VOC family protein [Marinoscillum pacificum]